MLTDKQTEALKFADTYISGHVYELRELIYSLQEEVENLKTKIQYLEKED